MNAASIFGQVIPGLIADVIGDPILMVGIFTLITTVLVFCWITIRTSITGLFIFCALYGFCSGAFVSLSTPATASLAPNLGGIGTRLGFYNGILGLGLLVGNPVAGAIAAMGWVEMQAFCGCACALNLLLVCSVMYVRGLA